MLRAGQVMEHTPCNEARFRATACSIVAWMVMAMAVATGRAADEPEKAAETGAKAESVAGAEERTSHQAVRRYEIGVGPRSYWLFEPDEPKPDRAPVVVFLHGWFAVNPGFYGAWIDHLVRNGRIVIFPRYQKDVGTLPADFLPNTLEAVRDALGVLHDGLGHVRPDTERFALIGHSAGGNLAAQLGAVSSDPHADLPVPRAIIAVMPGEVLPMREPNLARIPGTTLLVVFVGEDDLVVGDLRGRQIFAAATAVPPSRKRFILLRSDRHGFPPLIAEHTAPTGVHHRLDNGEGVFRALQLSFSDVNALDRAGFWRISNLTLQAAFAGRTLDEAICDNETFGHLGFWSDGRKVIPPIVSSDLSNVPRVVPGNGLRIFPWSFPSKPAVALDSSKQRE
jgi:acetyl esterase/lipase